MSYVAGRQCENCGQTSPASPTCGECEVAERSAEQYAADIADLRRHLDEVTAERDRLMAFAEDVFTEGLAVFAGVYDQPMKAADDRLRDAARKALGK